MILEEIKFTPFIIRVSGDEKPTPEFAIKLISLVHTAVECRLERILLAPPDDYTVFMENVVKNIIDNNGIIKRTAEKSRLEKDVEGNDIICNEEKFICIRNRMTPDKYSLRIMATMDNVELAPKVSAMITNILGFPGFISFGVRFSVYELLNNIVEYGIYRIDKEWIDLEIEKENDRLLISIADEGIEFDPTSSDEFNLDNYLKGGAKRGLGLMMIKKLNEKMKYARERKTNRVVIEKFVPGEDIPGKERNMTPLNIGVPKSVGEGIYKIELSGDLDSKGALILEETMNALLERKIHNVILDFDKLTFISSAGVGMLLGLVSSLRREKGQATFINVSEHVRSVFNLLNLNDYFEFSTPEEVAGR
ncbi:MAG: anti-sigma factor antagonist [Candidatus Krumholzibacteriota bacterium]|nr:anti-sigma factor antagonist [Candidatus Krumholzibacteriota bacterium]